jgi:hypothetical protein
MTAVQINILLLSLGAVQGLLLFFLLYKKRRSVPGYVFLAAYLAVMLLQVTLKIAGKIWLMKNLDPLYQFSYQLPFLYGPLLYLFVLKFTGYRQPRLRDIYHFLPSIIVISILVMMPPYQLLSWIYAVFFKYTITTPLQLVSIVAYHLRAFYILNKHGRQFNLSAPTMVRMKWLKQLTVVSMVVCSTVAFLGGLLHYNFPQLGNLRFGFIALTIFIYWTAYKALRQPKIFSVTRGNAASPDGPAPLLTVHLPAKKPLPNSTNKPKPTG